MFFPREVNTIHLTFFQTRNFRLFQTKSLQTTIANYNENCRKLFKQVENTERKGKIAHYEQFLLFLQCFQKTCTGLVWERVKVQRVKDEVCFVKKCTKPGQTVWSSQTKLVLNFCKFFKCQRTIFIQFHQVRWH